jgi:K+-transporting ATPase ATPase A chain
VLALTKPLGAFLYRVYERKSKFLDPILRPIERLIYRICGVDDAREMDWKGYGFSMLLFSGISLLLLYLIERTQQWLPLNPQKLPNLGPADRGWPPLPRVSISTLSPNSLPPSSAAETGIPPTAPSK